MTEERLVLADLLEKAGDGDFLRAVAEAVLQLLMESDVEGMIGAGVTSAAASAPPGATATATARSTPGSALIGCAGYGIYALHAPLTYAGYLRRRLAGDFGRQHRPRHRHPSAAGTPADRVRPRAQIAVSLGRRPGSLWLSRR